MSQFPKDKEPTHKFHVKKKDNKMTQKIYVVTSSGLVEAVDIKTVMPEFEKVSRRFDITAEIKITEPVRYILSKVRTPVEIIECTSSNTEIEPACYVAIRP